MGRKPKFNINDRVNFMAWMVEDKHGLDVLKSFVGYIKQVRRKWWGVTHYAICVAKTDCMWWRERMFSAS